ncbi:hypothetical protein [Pontibacter sp. BAB1700]|uniref:hypothetical protein n=1 Tax=Pontibacter sp. BAB1700 TaxID=1144253 RepID=UPI0012DDA0CC|nr:hypothetical protein [Pontibacter sp. BAB1700]
MDAVLTVDDESEESHVYAYNVRDEIIHISQAKSGRKGYFCLGCKREMQACITKIENRSSYFRHDPKGVEPTRKCTYSDETYRHQLAKEILQRIKKIKVPAVYKYPPKGVSGLANLLVEDRYVEAEYVENETCFYEDDNGEIRWGKKKDLGDRYLLVKPDVTFFDSDYQPILFIELVATHAPSVEKLVKIKRLGVDTIQVKIPKDSPEEIERSFFTTDKTKWLYSHEQERTKYVPISHPDAAGVPPIDELQRKLFEETYECRAAQIRSLIRGFRKCLESKPYKDIKAGIRDEISRVEKNTTDNQERLQRLQDRYRASITAKYSEQIRGIDEQEEALRGEEERLREDAVRAEEDNRREAAELDRAAGVLDIDITAAIRGLGGNRESFEERKREIELEEISVDRDIAAEEGRVEQIRATASRLPERFEELESAARSKFEQLEGEEAAGIAGIREARIQLPSRFEREGVELEERFAGLRDTAARTVESRDTATGSDLSRRLKNLLDAGGLLADFEIHKSAYSRNRKAWQCFNKRTYKNWEN